MYYNKKDKLITAHRKKYIDLLKKIFDIDDDIDIVKNKKQCKKKKNDKNQVKKVKSKKSSDQNDENEKEKIELLEIQVKELKEKLHKFEDELPPPAFDFNKIKVVDTKIEQKKHNLFEKDGFKEDEEEEETQELDRFNNSLHIDDTAKQPILSNELYEINNLSLDEVQTINTTGMLNNREK